ncbi:MAG: histone deacetylase family protein [Rhodocyclaceae bacterium]|nr:histone deacetylase family protein [Rhodocyclaceae bacterium]
MATAFFSHPDCARHEQGVGHPECPARLAAIEDQLVASGLMDHLLRVEARPASRQQLLRAHDESLLRWTADQTPSVGLVHLGDDITLNRWSLRAAELAAGAVVQAVDGVMAGSFANAFCNVRPPGHHASRNHSSGFCIFNNVAVGALHALEHHGLQRVAICDFDVHHGNGTESIFHEDARVLLCSSFQHPFYPFSGADTGNVHIVPTPLPAWSEGAAARDAVERVWLPALEAFKPEMLFISAGFDAHREDDMAMLGWREADYAWITARLKDIADRLCGGRIVSTLEGGYALSALGRSVAAHIRVLAGL